jgi:hypothetical protein
MDDNLDHVRIEWLRRLKGLEVSREEAQSVLSVLKARLDFLRNLHSRIADNAEWARDVEREIEDQVEEIRVVEEYIERPNRAD